MLYDTFYLHMAYAWGVYLIHDDVNQQCDNDHRGYVNNGPFFDVIHFGQA